MDSLPTKWVDPDNYQILLAGIKRWGTHLDNLENNSSGLSPAARLFGRSPAPTPHLLVDTDAPDVADLLKAIDDLTDCVTKVEDNKD